MFYVSYNYYVLIEYILCELIMFFIFQEYDNSAGEIGYFKDSQFLVFVNRILAFILSGIYISLIRQPRHPMPLYKYVFCSFSNIMSSWCQYEALKFISFPTQVYKKIIVIILYLLRYQMMILFHIFLQFVLPK